MALEVESGVRWFDRKLVRKVGNGMGTLFLEGSVVG